MSLNVTSNLSHNTKANKADKKYTKAFYLDPILRWLPLSDPPVTSLI